MMEASVCARRIWWCTWCICIAFIIPSLNQMDRCHVICQYSWELFQFNPTMPHSKTIFMHLARFLVVQSYKIDSLYVCLVSYLIELRILDIFCLLVLSMPPLIYLFERVLKMHPTINYIWTRKSILIIRHAKWLIWIYQTLWFELLMYTILATMWIMALLEQELHSLKRFPRQMIHIIHLKAKHKAKDPDD